MQPGVCQFELQYNCTVVDKAQAQEKHESETRKKRNTTRSSK